MSPGTPRGRAGSAASSLGSAGWRECGGFKTSQTQGCRSCSHPLRRFHWGGPGSGVPAVIDGQGEGQHPGAGATSRHHSTHGCPVSPSMRHGAPWHPQGPTVSMAHGHAKVHSVPIHPKVSIAILWGPGDTPLGGPEPITLYKHLGKDTGGKSSNPTPPNRAMGPPAPLVSWHPASTHLPPGNGPS